MAIVLKSPVSLNEKGKRKNNQDSIYPFISANTAQQRLFMVCDGVGGANKGEIASRMVCEAIAAYFSEHTSTYIDEQYVSKAVKYAEAKLARHTAVQAECAGMSTTLTLIWFDDATNRALVAWVGDSRVYQLRNGEVHFVTADHSLVNELVKRGDLTPEEAALHPQRNVILRAISDSGQPTKTDVVEITDIQAGDYFLLCSDGILESIDESILEVILPDGNADLEKAQAQIYEMCDNLSNDNFSMYLLNVANVSPATSATTNTNYKAKEETINLSPSHKTAEVSTSTNIAPTPIVAETEQHQTSNTKQESINTNKLIYIAGAICLVLILSLFAYKIMSGNKNAEYQNLIIQADSLRQQIQHVAADSLQQTQYISPNDSLNQTQNSYRARAEKLTEVMALYQKAKVLLPNNKEANNRIKEIQEELDGIQLEESLRDIAINIWADSSHFSAAKITKARVIEAGKFLDAAMLSNIREAIDSVKAAKSNDTLSNKIINNTNEAPKDSTPKGEQY